MKDKRIKLLSMRVKKTERRNTKVHDISVPLLLLESVSALCAI